MKNIREDINLKKIIGDLLVLSGRSNGEIVRKKLNISQKDADEKKYNIVIPCEVRTINPSYFIGIFSESIKNLKLEKFKKKYNFISSNDDGKLKNGIEEDIKEGIEWALDESKLLK